MPAWTSRPKDVLPANPAAPDIARLRTDEGVLLVLQDPRAVPGPDYPRAPKAPYLESVRVLRDEEHGAVFVPAGRSSDSQSARAFRGARMMLTAPQILAGGTGWVQHLDAQDQEVIRAWARAAAEGDDAPGEAAPTAEPAPVAEENPAPVTSGPSGHARLSPSAAARWMTCPGSVALCDTVPEPPESPAAREGTAGHAVAEARLVRDLLQDYVRAEEMLRAWQEEYGGEYDLGHMIQDVEPYVREVKVAAEALGVDSAMGVWLERRVRLSDTVYGTADAVLVGTDVIGDPWGHILDLKLGRGVRVDGSSRQLQIYAAALAREEEDRTGTPLAGVTVTIVQPRHRDGGHVSSRDYTAAELEAVVLEVEAAAEAALAGDGPRVPSEDACRWCSAQAVCPERMKSLADSVGLQDLTAEPPSVADLDRAALPDLLRALPDLERWIKAVRAHASTMLDLDPGSVPGWAMVEGRGRRKVTREAVDAAVSLGLADLEDLEVTTLVGVTQLKRVIGAEGMRAVGDLLETTPGSPTLTYVGEGA